MISWISERHDPQFVPACRARPIASTVTHPPATAAAICLTPLRSRNKRSPPVHNPLAGAPRDDRKTCSWLGKIDAKLIHSPVARDGDRLGREEEGACQTIHRKAGETKLAGLPVGVREHAAVFPHAK
jgi:hypothetical protein